MPCQGYALWRKFTKLKPDLAGRPSDEIARLKREGHEVTYIFVRPSGYDLGEHITPLVAEGGLRPTLQETFPLERAADAHERIEEGHVRGKLVLTVD